MNKRDKNKRLKGFGIPVELCVRKGANTPIILGAGANT